MECPFKKELKEGKMVCDFMGVKHEPGVVQCPTETFNQCQTEANEEALKEFQA